MKKLVSLILAVTVLITVALPAMAYTDSGDWKSFRQGDARWSSVKYSPSSNNTIGVYGCMITSIAILMAYSNPELRDVNTFNPGILGPELGYSGGSIQWGTTTNYDSTFIQRSSVSTSLYGEAAASTIKSYLDRGFYLVVGTKGTANGGVNNTITSSWHYSPIVGFSDGIPQIFDVGSRGNNNWNDWAASGICQIVVYESQLTPSGSAFSGSGGTTSSGPSSALSGARAIISEWAITGMPKQYPIGEVQRSVSLENTLSSSEKVNVSAIQENIEYRGVTLAEIGRVSIRVLGLLMLVYAMLVLFAYLFDYVNVFIEFSLLGVITFGRYKIIEHNEGAKAGTKKGIVYLTKGMLLLRVLFLALVGVFLLSGAILNYLYDLYSFIIK